MKRIASFGIPVSDLLVHCDAVEEALAHYRRIERLATKASAGELKNLVKLLRR